MRAAYIEQTGPPEAIKVGDLPRPEPGPGQVLVRVQAVSLNPIDLYIRSGLVAMPLSFPYVIGCDLSGTVETGGAGLLSLSRLATVSGARTRDCSAGKASRPSTPPSMKVGFIPRPPCSRTPGPRRWPWSGSPPTSGCSNLASSNRGKSSTFPAAAAGSARWSSRWPRPRVPGWRPSAGSPERVELCRRLGADLAMNYKTDDIPARSTRIRPRRRSTSGTRPSASPTSKSPFPCSASTAA